MRPFRIPEAFTTTLSTSPRFQQGSGQVRWSLCPRVLPRPAVSQPPGYCRGPMARIIGQWASKTQQPPKYFRHNSRPHCKQHDPFMFGRIGARGRLHISQAASIRHSPEEQRKVKQEIANEGLREGRVVKDAGAKPKHPKFQVIRKK
jgi:hypothetical protein